MLSPLAVSAVALAGSVRAPRRHWKWDRGEASAQAIVATTIPNAIKRIIGTTLAVPPELARGAAVAMASAWTTPWIAEAVPAMCRSEENLALDGHY